MNNSGTVAVNSGASIIAQSSTSFDLTYHRSIGTTNWYLVSSGVTNETIEDLIANHSFATGSNSSIGIGDYVNTTASWTYSTSGATGTLASGEGRSIKLSEAGDFTFTGNMPLSDVDIAISDGTSSGGTGFNLIGNPFPSYLPVNNTSPTVANSILRANTGVLEEETVWIWDQSEDSYTTINQASAISNGIRYIPPGQGFIVKSNGTGGNFTFAESMQSHQSIDNFKTGNTTIPIIKLVMEGDGTEKETNIYYLSSATTGWDNGFDSTMFGGSGNTFAIYTHLVSDSQGQDLAIQSLPDSNYESMIVPVGMNVLSGITIELRADVSDFPPGIDVYLEDRQENTFVRLNTPNSTYSITPSQDLESIGRFYLHTTSNALSVNNTELANISTYLTSPTNLQITGINSGQVALAMYSILGQPVHQSEFTGQGVNNITLPRIAAGVYILKLQGEQGKLTRKIIIE